MVGSHLRDILGRRQVVVVVFRRLPVPLPNDLLVFFVLNAIHALFVGSIDLLSRLALRPGKKAFVVLTFPKQVLHVVGEGKVQDGLKQVVNQVLPLRAECARSLF